MNNINAPCLLIICCVLFFAFVLCTMKTHNRSGARIKYVSECFECVTTTGNTQCLLEKYSVRWTPAASSFRIYSVNSALFFQFHTVCMYLTYMLVWFLSVSYITSHRIPIPMNVCVRIYRGYRFDLQYEWEGENGWSFSCVEHASFLDSNVRIICIHIGAIPYFPAAKIYHWIICCWR